MRNLFELAGCCLHQADVDEKLAVTHLAWSLYQQDRLDFQMVVPVAGIEQTRFPEYPILKRPKEMPRRKFTTKDGVSAMIHAFAHIEFMAINLAWDMLYRFRNLPVQFYLDWLKVAEEEARHFILLRELLDQRGLNYGDLPAHAGLWVHAVQTDHDVLARLALIPRCMEARGLDVTPAMIENFKRIDDFASADVLATILEDEVGHVKIGSDWFDWVCFQRQVDPIETYQQLILQFLKQKPKGPFNKEMRIIAGFSQAELDWLEND